MSHFGITCPEPSGHLNPMLALARELQRRGHRVTFYLRPIGQPKVEQAGFACRTFGVAEFPPEVSRAAYRRLAELSGIRALLHTLKLFRRATDVLLRDLPVLVREDGIEALLVDQTLGAGETVAEVTRLPYAVICTSVPMQGEPTIPPFHMSWRYRTDRWGVVRNQIAYRVLGRLARPTRNVLNEHRLRLGLRPTGDVNASASPWAQICLEPAEFEFPRRHLPECMHFTGPLTDPSTRVAVDFPYDKLDGRPLVYASLGTMQNRQRYIFQRIARACASLDVQLVMSLGGGCEPGDLGVLPGSPLVVSFAPQLDLLKRAALCITHAGMNTTMECLAEGVPMVAIPITNDQPGVAARIAWTGCGEFLCPRRLRVRRLHDLIRKVLEEPKYREAALQMRDAIVRAGGVKRAADIVEQITSFTLTGEAARLRSERQASESAISPSDSAPGEAAS